MTHFVFMFKKEISLKLIIVIIYHFIIFFQFYQVEIIDCQYILVFTYSRLVTRPGFALRTLIGKLVVL